MHSAEDVLPVISGSFCVGAGVVAPLQKDKHTMTQKFHILKVSRGIKHKAQGLKSAEQRLQSGPT